VKERSAVDVAPKTQLEHADAVIDIFAFGGELEEETQKKKPASGSSVAKFNE
jgi:hypothetical protein